MTAVAESEADFERRIVAVAHTFGWRVASFRPGMNRRGRWATPVKYDGKGWPDLTLCHPDTRQVLFVEVKTARGRVTPEQAEWLDALPSGQVAVWRPADWPEIVARLSFGKATG